MERLPQDKLLEYNPDTLLAVRKLYNLDKPGQMDEAIDLLEAWVKKQSHFTKKDFPRDYLERVIMLLKGSVERAKSQIEKICTLRTLLPHFFDKYDAKTDLKEVKDSLEVVLCPKLTKDNYRLYMMKFLPDMQYTSELYMKIYIYSIMISEYLKSHDYCDGLITILDYRSVSIVDFVSAINITEMRQIATIALEGYDSRLKNFYILSNSKAIELLMKIFKQMLSEKLGQRMFVFKTIEELHEHVPRDLLPSDYGGKEKPSHELSDALLDAISSKEHIAHLKEMSKARTLESCRNNTKFNEEYLGLAGTFRTLSFD